MSNHMRTLFLTRVQPDSASSVFEEDFDGCIPFLGNESHITKHDVVLFDGGTDVNPALYGEEPHPFTDKPDTKRDEFERAAFRKAQAAGAACIGICRGAQLLCVLSGGKLIQHVNGHKNSNHAIITLDGKCMVAAADHHQMMHPTTVHHQLIAWTSNVGESLCEYGKDFDPDREPEILYIPDTRALCIQPHPEWMHPGASFVNYCRDLVTRYLFKG